MWRLAALGAALAMVAGAALCVWWSGRHTADVATLMERVRVQDSTIVAQERAIARARDSITALGNAPARVVERVREVPRLIPSPPDTIDLTDTTAVRTQLAEHRAVEDSLRAQVQDVHAKGVAAADTLDMALANERRLTAAQAAQLVTLTTRVATTDSLVQAYKPQWIDRLSVSVGYGVRTKGLEAVVGYSVPLAKLAAVF